MCFNYTLPSICQASGAMGERGWGGRTKFRPGLESFSITYDVSLESTLIELPNLFFKQQCPGPDPWRETIRYKFKAGHFIYFIFSWFTQRKSRLTHDGFLRTLHASGSFNVRSLTISDSSYTLKMHVHLYENHIMISGCAYTLPPLTCTVCCASLQMVLEATIIISVDAKDISPN